MKDSNVAGRYARALFIVTEKRGETTRALEDLKRLWEMFRPGTRVGALLATPMVLLSDKRKVVKQALEGKAVASVVLFVDLLLRKTRLQQFETVVTQFEALVEKQQGIQRAYVTSAIALTPEELQRLHAELERTQGSKINLAADIDPRLLGGALVRIGDRVIDRSVKGLLEAIEHQLMEVSV